MFPGRAFAALFRGLNYHELVAAARKKFLRAVEKCHGTKIGHVPFEEPFLFTCLQPRARGYARLAPPRLASPRLAWAASPPVTFSTRIQNTRFRIFRLPSFFPFPLASPLKHVSQRCRKERDEREEPVGRDVSPALLLAAVLFIDDLFRSLIEFLEIVPRSSAVEIK